MRQRNLLPHFCYIAFTTERINLKNRLGTANPEEKVTQPGETICQSWSQTRLLVFPPPSVLLWNSLKLEAYAIPELNNREVDAFFLVFPAFWEVSRSHLSQQCQAKQLPSWFLCSIPTASNRPEVAVQNWSITAATLDYSILWLHARWFLC